MTDYAHPEVLVDTAWVEAHHRRRRPRRRGRRGRPALRRGTCPAPCSSTGTPSCSAPTCATSSMRAFGISNDTTVVLYGDKSNWWAAYAFWFRSTTATPTCGSWTAAGRSGWRGAPAVDRGRPPGARPLPRPVPRRVDPRLRARRAAAPAARQGRRRARSSTSAVAEYSGEKLHMPEYPQEGALRGGHVPGAVNVPWAKAVEDDGTFRPSEQLRDLYGGLGVTPDKDVVAYCRPARLPARPQLRRLLDGVGQHGRGADRAGRLSDHDRLLEQVEAPRASSASLMRSGGSSRMTLP
jgi:thiosulfate/3-mercaptopyruvate sulfurtransferase